MYFGDILDKVIAYDFDVYILGWRIGSDPTDFLWAFFCSQGSQNYVGYHNASLDKIIDLARSTDDQEKRIQWIKLAQAAIVYDVPYDVLYYRYLGLLYNSKNFVNWSIGSDDTLFWWGSILGIHPPYQQRLCAIVHAPMDVRAGENNTIEIVVRDKNRFPIEGAYIKLDGDNGLLSPMEGFTDTNGILQINFNSEETNRSKNVSFNVLFAEKRGYDPAPGKMLSVSIHPIQVKFIRLSAKLDQDVVKAGESSTLKVHVLDQDRRPLPDADVWANCSDGASIQPRTTRTNSEGYVTFTIVANQTNRSSVTISITAQKDGFPPSQDYTSLLLLASEVAAPLPNSNVPYDNEVLVVIGVVILIAIVAALAAARRLRR